MLGVLLSMARNDHDSFGGGTIFTAMLGVKKAFIASDINAITPSQPFCTERLSWILE